MEQTTINGYKVMIFHGYDGTQLFINDPKGQNIYAHRVSGDAIERAKEIIARETTLAPETLTVKSRAICLSTRKAEFKSALKRGLENEFEVYPDFEPDTFVVVNRTKQTEYRVKLGTHDAKVFASCGCRDFEFRRHLCKHIAEVLQDNFFGVTASFGVVLNA